MSSPLSGSPPRSKMLCTQSVGELGTMWLCGAAPYATSAPHSRQRVGTCLTPSELRSAHRAHPQTAMRPARWAPTSLFLPGHSRAKSLYPPWLSHPSLTHRARVPKLPAATAALKIYQHCPSNDATSKLSARGRFDQVPRGCHQNELELKSLKPTQRLGVLVLSIAAGPASSCYCSSCCL